MKNFKGKISIFIFGYFFLPFLLNSQISPETMIDLMGRGINLGNTLSAPIEGNWAPPVKESYFEDVKNAGFKTVRIPIRFDQHTTGFEEVNYTDNSGNYIGSIGDYEVESSYLDRIETVVNWALERDLVAIIDVHGDHWFWDSYDPDEVEYKTGPDRLAAEDRFRAIWTAISNRFQMHGPMLLFEIMNEPYFSMNADQVHYVNMDILSIIRENNPNRNVIITGGGQNSWESPFSIKPQLINSDQFLIATFHYYKPREFTVSSREGFNDFDWGNEVDKQEVDYHFDQVKDWSEANGIPVLLGEFGADNEGGYNYAEGSWGEFGGPTKESREAYHGYLAEAAINRGFAFTAWDAGEKSNKTIYIASTRTWVEGVKNALLGNDVSIKDASYDDGSAFIVFPNPAMEQATILSKEAVDEMRLVNYYGRIIESYDVNDFELHNGYYHIELDTSALPPGCYFIWTIHKILRIIII